MHLYRRDEFHRADAQHARAGIEQRVLAHAQFRGELHAIHQRQPPHSIAIRWQPVGIDRWLQASRVKSSELSGGSHPRTLRACSMSLQRQRLLEIASKISKRRLAGASRHFSMMPTQSRWLSSRGNGAPAWDGWCPGPHPDGCTGQRARSSATRGARGSRKANGRR